MSCLRCCRRFKLRFALLVVLMPAMTAGSGIADEVKPDSAEAAVPESKENAPEAKKEPGAEGGPTQIAKKNIGADEPPQNPFPQAVAVPDGILDGGTEWLNTSHPIDLKDLRGKVVLLDFWTYCCINCIHVLPDLKYLEEKYGNQLVVIGVHSAKFDNEKVSQNIRDAILRYEIQHPVINDSEMLLWRKFGVQAWPTLALVDPEGKYAGSQGGEGNRELFDNVIGKLVEYHRWKGTLDETPIVFESEASKVKPTPLRYPGKVLADAAGKRLFITDSNHNRIVVTSLDGELQQLIGSGRIGRADGSFEAAEFNRPQGTALVGNKLYVSDTENHLLRVVDLDTKMVSTLAGTGEQGPPGGKVNGPLLETRLNSPWSIALMGETLYIAMAGPHQIWSHKLGSSSIGVFAGSGREDVINGSLTASAFAQPSEIVADSAGRSLYLVDSEGSSIREIVPARNKVTTIAGTSELPRGQSLFAFGDVDGVGEKARFQHPLGIAIAGENLLVADSYNHKLREVNPKTGKTTTWAGTGDPGDSVEPLALNEPGGLSVAEGRLFVADTNNHRILSIDLASQKTLVLPITGLTPPNPAKRPAAAPDSSDAITVDVQKIAVTDKLKFTVTLTIPEGFKRNDLAPVTWEVFAEGEQSLVAADLLGARDEATTSDQNVAQFELPLNGQPGEATLIVRMSYGYCGTEENALCRLASAAWKIPVVLNTDGGVAEIALTFPQP